MSDEPFKVYKAHKLMDWIENEVTEWAYNQVTEHFGVDSPEELSREQIEEVIAEMENFDDCVILVYAMQSVFGKTKMTSTLFDLKLDKITNQCYKSL